MAVIPPVVRHMLLCDDVTRNPDKPEKLNILGLTAYAQAPAGASFPIRLPRLCVCLLFTNGRGPATVKVVLRQADTDRLVARSPSHQVIFPSEPLLVHAMAFRLLNCVFPQPGLYQVEFRVDNQVIALEPLLVR